MADERTYKMLLGAIAGGGSGGLPDYSEANDGDVLAIENGEPAWAAPSGGGILVITETEDVLDKTWQEIYDAMAANTFCICVSTYSGVASGANANFVQNINSQEGTYSLTLGDDTYFEAATANDYPVVVD